ncbi:hypothetical protein [Rhodococcus sp. NPDC058521]|uniref:TY-Chap domain-containing protein n=1 Tax=Rhodococcus sp. NPDC058521 TaxID=3346536 RepID=UPI00364E775B
MSGVDTFEYDNSVQRSWNAFTSRLADAIADLQLHQVLTIDSTFDAADTNMPQCVQFYAWSEDLVRCEVPSNHYLPDNLALTEHDESRLVELGWHRPSRTPNADTEHGSPAFWVDLPYSWADKLATMTVAAFREVWDVPHPSFLDTSGFEDLVPTPAAEPDASTELNLKTPIEPRDVEHLRDAVEQTITATFDAHYGRDDDSDMWMTVDFTTAFIWSGEERPNIHIHVPLVRDITNRTRAAEVAADLNGRWPYFRAVVVGDRLNATCDLAADPFIPQHLYNTLEILLLILQGADDAFASSLGGILQGPKNVIEEVTPTAADDSDKHSDNTRRPLQSPQLGLFDTNSEPTLFDTDQ